VIHGDQRQNWLILQNEASTIGLFQGMFDRNILTSLATEADDSSTGPASFTVLDLDGNPVLIDQHVSRPHS
jgi:hypothetical protein